MAAFTPFLQRNNSHAVQARAEGIECSREEVLMIKYDTRKFSIPLRENRRESVVLDRSIGPSSTDKVSEVFFCFGRLLVAFGREDALRRAKDDYLWASILNSRTTLILLLAGGLVRWWCWWWWQGFVMKLLSCRAEQCFGTKNPKRGITQLPPAVGLDALIDVRNEECGPSWTNKFSLFPP